MLSIIILGTGNLAHHLFNAIYMADDAEVIQVYGRNQSHLDYFEKHIPTTTDLSSVKDADMYLIAVKDGAIAKVASFLEDKTGLVVHTSGSVSLCALKNQRKGVFYPLQTFSKERNINFREVPVCLESNNSEDLRILKNLANQMSISVHEIDSGKRKRLHLAAVFVNNFTNHLYNIGSNICEEENLPFDLLFPLIYETAKKANDLTPICAQTGPARRNDIHTMQNHLDMIENPMYKKIYQLVSESIRMNDELGV